MNTPPRTAPDANRFAAFTLDELRVLYAALLLDSPGHPLRKELERADARVVQIGPVRS